MKKIIFDLDSTILFMSDKWIDYYQKFINKYNLGILPTELYNSIDLYEIQKVGLSCTKEDLWSFVNNNLNININEKMFNDYLKYYADIPLEDVDIVKKTLKGLSNKYELIAYSNWFADNQITRLKKYDLDNYFSKIYGWDNNYMKPSLEGIKKIIGNDDLNDYIVIGDNIEIDLDIPFKIGIKTIFLNNKGIVQEKYQEINKIEQLLDIL